jgi:hypothetical protein
MTRGVGAFLWQIAVGLYLFANGILGIQKGGDFAIIYRAAFGRGDLTAILITVTGVVALVAGLAVIVDLFGIELNFINTLLFIIAIVWAVYLVIEIVSWVRGVLFKNDTLFHVVQLLAVHLMVLGSLLTASKKFER